MKKKLLLCVISMFVAVSVFSQTVGLEKGNKMPDFTLTTLDGKTVKLSDFRGKPVFLNFWATWCPPCVWEMPFMQKMYQKYSKDLVMLAVNAGERKENVTKFIAARTFTFPILLDNGGKISALLQIQAIPTTFMIDKAGVISDVKLGALPEEDMEKAIKGMLKK